MYSVIASFRRGFGLLLFGLIVLCNSCSSQNANKVATSSSVAALVSEQPGGMRSGSEWPSYNGGYNATRFSSLSRINTGNVASLAEVARFKLPRPWLSSLARC